MTRLVWDQQADKHYESGVSHGVLYPEEGPGVVWNGLVSVQEGFVGGEISSYHFDGIKYLDMMAGKDFIATLRAFSAPREFEPCVGEVSPRPGFILTGQQKVRFGFCYRTELGDGDGYKLHLVYNAVASRTKRDYLTLAKAAVPTLLEFKVETVPVPGETFKASAHFVLDSTKVPSDILAHIEELLYGTATEEPTMPDPAELATIAATPLTVVRRNLVTNPDFEIDTVDWAAVGGSIARSTSSPISGLASLLITGAGGGGSEYQYTRIPLVSGKTYTYSFDYKTIGALAIPPWVGVGLSPYGGMYLPQNQPTPARFSVTRTEASSGSGWFWFQNLSSGAQIVIDRVLIEEADEELPYFDGDTPDTETTIYAWEGTPRASASTASERVF